MSKNEYRAVRPPISVPQQRLEWKMLGRKSMHNFLRDRERSRRLAKESVEQGSTFQPVALVASLDFDLLSSLAALDTILSITTLDEVTDDILLRWISQQHEDTLESFSLEDLDDMVKKSVHIEVHEPDAKLRMMSLFADYKTFYLKRK